jgi:hypothetical protein
MEVLHKHSGAEATHLIHRNVDEAQCPPVEEPPWLVPECQDASLTSKN